MSRLSKLLSVIATSLVTGSAAAEEPVSLQDVEGSVIEYRVVIDRMVRKSGRDFASQLQLDNKVEMREGGKLVLTTTATSRSTGGVRRGQTRTTPVRSLNQTNTTDMGRGQGHGVWIFEPGRLTHLRTYKTGAMKETLTFARGPKGLTCTATHGWALEEGKRTIEVTSAVDGLPLTILSFRQVSQSCRVTGKG